MKATRTERSTVMSSFPKYSIIPLGFAAQCCLLYSEGDKWLMCQFCEQWFRGDCFSLWTHKPLVFSIHLKTGFKKIIYRCLIFFELCLSALTFRTDIRFKNILRTFLNYKILSQNILNNSNSICIYHKWKQVFAKFLSHYSQYLNLCSLRNLKNYWPNGYVISSSKYTYINRVTRGAYGLVAYLVIHWSEE